MTYKAEIPYGAYWSTPFAKWQGKLADLNSVPFAAHVAKQELAKREIDPEGFDFGVLGMTVPQHRSFYGLPWLMGMIGAMEVGGPTVMQACATGVRTVQQAAQEIESGMAEQALAMTCDRVSNGPQIYYPNPRGIGGGGELEAWTTDNMTDEPIGHHSMTQTAENCAVKYQLTTAEQHEVVLTRQAQYQDALADDQAFMKRYMTLPFEVPTPNYKKTASVMEGDEGLTTSTAEGLAGLRTVIADGTVTFGGQTHPADGNAALVLTTPERAKEMSTDPNVRVRILGFGLARAELAYMPMAPVPAARRALEQAGLEVSDLDAVKTHNPFAVNDLIFSRETGVAIEDFNNYGCSLIWGHPQAPMGTRAVIELIEELAIKGGGNGLFTGCAAGDTSMSIVIKVGD